MKRKLMLLLACLFVGIGMIAAQTQTITGVVISEEDGQPVVGASLVVKGTSVGTVTDLDGKFKLANVPSTAKSLVVSYIGMQTEEVSIKPTMTIYLKSDSELLDEVIVVAYGTAKKASFTGSATTISSKKLESRPITNISKGLEGQSTGILTTSGSGQPGSEASVVIRGFGSINASQAPLYVVDGVPFNGSISSINPADIESLTVLKDASAGALYGARGANGVIMITTKKGQAGKTNVSLRATLGWANRALKAYDMVDQKEFAQLSYEALRNGYAFDGGYDWETAGQLASGQLASSLGGEQYNPFKNYTWATLIDPTTGQVRSDAVSAWDDTWMDAIERKNALRQEYQLSVNGGSEKLKFMFSLGYLNEDGILKTTGFQRYNGRANIDATVTDWFKAGFNAAMSNSTQNFSDYSGSSNSNVWYSAQFIAPIYPTYLKDAAGKDLLDENGNKQLDYGEGGRPKYNDFNPVGTLTDDQAYVTNDNASVRADLVFGTDADYAKYLKGLKLHIRFGADYRTQNQMSYMNMYHGNQVAAGGLLRKLNSRMQSYTFNQLLTWDRTFGKNNFDVLAGHEYYAYKYQYLAAGKTNLVDGILELRPGTTLYDADSYTNDYRIESWLGRVNYNFDEKYYLSGSIRRDGSSRFHKNNRWGTFWSAGGNWRISQEAFMKDVDWVSNLALRASYGEQGNDALGTYYAWQSLYSLSWANANQIGGLVSSLENQNISWEKSGNLNIGIDATLFDNRMSVSAEYYNRKTTDMLLEYPMALSTGFTGYNDNVGDMRNSGFEFDVRVTPIRTSKLTWNVTWMGTTTKNKVLKLTQESDEIISGIFSIKEGMPLRTFYMAKSAGVDPATGSQLYWVYDKDDAGNIVNERVSSDYAKAANSKYYLGNRVPKLYGSLGTDISYKGFDLNILTTYSIGGKVYDGLYYSSMNVTYAGDTWNKNALRRWQQPGDITDVPRVELGGRYTVTDRFLVNASYFNIKNITLGYNLPKNLMRKAGLSSLRIFASADNVAMFNHMNGMDPQYNFSGSTDYTYTPNRTYTVGFELNF